MENVIGIVGGMGPEAGCYLHQKIIEYTPVNKDQDHFEVILHTNSKVPDRTLAILKHGENPVKEINRSIEILQNAGANIIVLACVTAHYFAGKFKFSKKTKFINIVELSAQHIKKHHPDIKEIGLLATSGTIKSGFIPRIFASHGIRMLALDGEDQENYVMSAIYGEDGIKKGNKSDIPKKKLINAVSLLKEKKCKGILAGCTEVPLALSQKDIDLPLFDVMDICARYLVDNFATV
jgi:aspartate racemase